MDSNLSPKHLKFVLEYLKDLNATQAAIRAGYSQKTARSIGQRLLTNVDIQKEIKKLQEQDAVNCGITREKWLNELKLCGFSDMRNYIDIDEEIGTIRAKGFDNIPEEASRAIKKVKEKRIIKESNDGESHILDSTFEFELHPKLQALDLIGKHLGFFEKPDKDPGSEPVPVEGVDPGNAIEAIKRITGE